jgi:hypothetical protein
MRLYSLFELFLVVFACYAALKWEDPLNILVPFLCLIADLLFERLKNRVEQEPIVTAF